jgi:hypothetical protein
MSPRAAKIIGRIAPLGLLTVVVAAILNGCEWPKSGNAPSAALATPVLQGSDPQHVKALLHELSKPSGRPVQPPSGEFRQSLASLYARIGDSDAAFSVAKGFQSVQGRMQSYIKIGETCAIIEDLPCIQVALGHIEADDLARKITNPYTGTLAKQSRLSALTVIAMAQIKGGNLNGAEETFSRIDLASLHPELAEQSRGGFFKELAMAYVRARDAKSALRSVEQIKKASSRDHAFADVAVALAEVGDSRGAKQAIELLRKSKLGIHLAPRIVEALVKSGEKEEAARFLQPLLQTALESRNEWAIGDCVVALAFLDPTRARQTAPISPETSGAYSPRDSAFASIAAIQAKVKDVSGALETIELVRHAQTHDTTLMIAAEDFVKRNDLPHALELAKAIRQSTWKNTLAKVQVLIGDVPGAMRLANSFPGSFEKSQAFSSIVEAQIMTNALQDAVQTARLIDQDNIKDRTYTDLALAHARTGQLSMAITLVGQVMYQRRAEVTRKVGLVYAAAGKWKDAWKIPQLTSAIPGKDSLMLGLVEGMLDYRTAQENKAFTSLKKR